LAIFALPAPGVTAHNGAFVASRAAIGKKDRRAEGIHFRLRQRGHSQPVGPLARLLALIVFASPALACEVPADEGSTPLRRLVSRVKYLPETEAWQKTLPAGTSAQFVLLVDSPQRIRGRCYWPVEVRAGGELWKRYLVAADGGRVRRR
jgi:hypothetical protein